MAYETQSPGDLGYNGFPVSLNYFVAVPEVQVIEDPNIAVLFKALSKKNSVTKEKNLTDLIKTFKDESVTVTDAVIMCWIQSYSKLALDNSKQVRSLAHQVQGTLLRRVGGREFGKYLKSSIPLWLSSLFDSDTSVAKGTLRELLESFQNDRERIDTKLWQVFYEQIVNYVYSVVCVESDETLSDPRYVKKEDSVAKYERALIGSIQMLRKLIDMSNAGEIVFSEESVSQISQILLSEELWKSLETCTEPETLNSGLFKAYIALLKKLFELDESKNPSKFASQIDIKSLYKLLSKKIIKSIKLKSGGNTQAIIYSSIIIQFWDLLNVLTSFSQMNSESKKALKIKKNFWELTGSKAHSRLIGYIELGPCNSDAIYYDVLRSFFRSASAVELKSDEDIFLDFGSSKDAKSIVDTLLSQFPSLPSFAFKATAVECIFYVLSLFHSSNAEELKQKAFLVALDGLSSTRIRQNEIALKEKALSILANAGAVSDLNALDQDFCESLKAKATLTLSGYDFKNSFQSVASTYIYIHDQDQTKKLLDQVLITLSDVFELDELARCFEAILCCLKRGFSQEFEEWIPLLPSFCTPGFTDLPFEVLRIVLQKEIEAINYRELVSDIFTKLKADVPQAIPEFIGILRQSPVVSETEVPEVKAYLDSSSHDIVFQYVDDPKILRNLLFSTQVEDDPSPFVEAIVKSKTQLRDLEKDAKERLAKIIVQSFLKLDAQLIVFFWELIDDKSFIPQVLFRHLDLGHKIVYSKLASILSGHIEYFSVGEVSKRVHEAVEDMDLSSIAMSNPLSQNVYLGQSTSSGSSIDRSMVGIATLLVSVLSSVDTPESDTLLLAILVTEYLSDAVFLANQKDSLANSLPELESLSICLREQLKGNLLHASEFLSENPKSPLDAHLMEQISQSAPFTVSQVYLARFATRALSSEFEGMAASDFETLEFKATRLANQPLKLAVFLSSVSKFLGSSKKFERLRTFVFSEILGIKSSSDILGKGKCWLALAINFLDVSSDEYPDYQVQPTHKLGMVINHFADWLESEVAYDEDFLVIRSLLATFFTKLLTFTPEFVPERSWELAFDLCLNNLGSAQLYPKNLDLRFAALRLCSTLLRSTEKQGPWKDSRNALIEELCDFMLSDDLEKFNAIANNQPVKMTNDLLKRIIGGVEIPSTILANNAEKYLKKVVDSTIVEAQRIAASLLQKEIFSTRDDFVVEYQLNKTNLGDSQDDSPKAKLPELLIDATKMFDKDLELLIEHDEAYIAFRYLWSWLLIFAHFKDSTYGIRTDFIRQLNENSNIEHLLNVIFDHVEITDGKFLKSLTTGNLDKMNRVNPEDCLIGEYSIAGGCPGEDILYEMRFLLVHLYFMCLQYLGSPSQQWFSEIRDLQLKKDVEKFSAKFISPMLISEMLNEVDESKSKLIKDDSFSIKVNKTINEVRSVYIIDEQRMEMVVKIPETFPLSSVIVSGPLRLGVNEKQWKAWLLASQRVVSLTNGSIIDCIELFNRNVNLHFSGFEECAICYSILHQDHSLPSKTCSTCSNKFHAACLYKWFKSSGSSTCPLCRTAFNFRTARA